MGSLSLLQWIFLTQELNWGLLHWRWILYQLSCQGSPHADNEGATLRSPGVGLIKYIHKEPSTFSRNVWHFFKPLHPMCLPFACSPVQANTLCSRWGKGPAGPSSGSTGARGSGPYSQVWAQHLIKLILDLETRRRSLEKWNWNPQQLWVIHQYVVWEIVFMFAKKWYMENVSLKTLSFK